MGMTFCRGAHRPQVAPLRKTCPSTSLGKPVEEYRYANATSGTWDNAS